MPNIGKFFVVTLAAFAIIACGGYEAGVGQTPAAKPTAGNAPLATSTADAGDGPNISELAKGVVQILALDANDTPVWHGSGTVIDSNGLILTNAHVVDEREGEYARLGISIIDRTDAPPTLAYFAEIAAIDYVLDLAVIRIVRDLYGNPANFNQPAVAIGNSDDIELGDALQILGFPGIGGETITLTKGTVSGFNAQPSIATRAWIKTDATIAGGNSGGLAVNTAGQLIGVPTIAGSTEDVTPVDCRIIVDTNRDGVVNDSDTCVPIGGFINGLRPVALALPLIQAARDGRTYASAFSAGAATNPDFDVDGASFTGLIFADGMTEDALPTNVVKSLPTRPPTVCAFWDYSGMVDGVSVEALWFRDSTFSGGVTDQTWVYGETGTLWTCFDPPDGGAGLEDGLYKLVLNVEGQLVATDSLYVGGEHPLVAITIENLSTNRICYVQMSPSGAINWGPDELGSEEIIDPQQSWTFEIAATTLDLRLLDCDENVLAEEYELDATESGFYTLE